MATLFAQGAATTPRTLGRSARVTKAAPTRTPFGTRQRLMVVQIAFMLMIGAIVLQLAVYGFTGGRAQSGAASGVAGARGDIVDRNGVPLARTINAYAVRVDPAKLINNPVHVARELAGIFPDIPEATLLAKLRADRPSYIRRRALPEQVAAVNAIGEIGIDFPRETERFYPQLSLGAHVLGFTDAQGKGVTGAEAAFNTQITDAAKTGAAFPLSIDARVQSILETELGAAVLNLEALGGAGIILDAQTGEVLALSSLPTYNPNKLSGAGAEARRNAVTHNVYELGSTFKPLTVAAAIDAGTATSMARRYEAAQPIAIAGFQIRDTHSLGRALNIPETLMHSSNIATARIADELGREPLEKMFRALEFDRRPSIELAERGKSLWPRDWGRVTTMTTAYGHGIAVTPLHLASAYAAMVNGGIWRPATLRRIDGAPPAGRRVFKAATSARMRQLLRMIVSDGTGKKADAPGFRVGGKTGSAEKPSAGGYARHSVVATFAAAFPMDNPRYVVLVMVDEPKGNAFSSGQRTAAWTAAPVVKNVIMRAGPMLGVMPDTTRDVDVSDLVPLVWKPKDGA